MAKNSKNIISLLFAFTLTLALALPSFAAEAVFSKKYVDSNTWSYITSATKETKTTYADVKSLIFSRQTGLHPLIKG